MTYNPQTNCYHFRDGRIYTASDISAMARRGEYPIDAVPTKGQISFSESSDWRSIFRGGGE